MLRLLIACSLALLLTVCLGARAAGVEPIRIGAVFNLSGAMSSIDGPGFQGMKLAVTHINADGGVLGCPLDIALLDGASDVDVMARGIPGLAARGVVAIGGLNDSDYALAAGRAAQAAGIPFVAAGATLPDLPERVGDLTFMTAFGDDAQAFAMADLALDDLGAHDAWVLVDEGHVFPLALARFFTERLTSRGGTVALRDVYRGGDRDVSRQIAALKALPTPPGVLFVSALPDDAGRITQRLRAAGIAQPILSGDGFDTPLLVETAGRLATGVYFATHVSLENPDPALQGFVRAYTATYGHPPENGFAALGYDMTLLIADAIRRAGSTDATALRDALAATRNLDAVTGDIGYAPGRRVPHKVVTIIGVEQGVARFVKAIRP